LSGAPGKSLRINLRTGKWKDFADGVAGGDLVSLYAAIHGISQVEAARRLGGTSPRQSFVNGNGHDHHPPLPDKTASLVPPPKGTKKPSFRHPKHGDATGVWAYRGAQGEILYFIARYDTESGKQFAPWSWSAAGKWTLKAWPEPRPLYGVELLEKNPGRPVLIVEGEKACDAARALAGHVYCVVTWQGGAQAIKKTDFTPVHGRKILLWPDADQPGIDAMCKIAEQLIPHCPEVKLIEPGEDTPPGWDAADSVADDVTFKGFVAWAKQRVHVYAPVNKLPPATATTTGSSPGVEIMPAAGAPRSQLNVFVSAASDPVPATGNFEAAWDRLELGRTQRAGPIINVLNVVKILDRWEPLRKILWFDEFFQRVMTVKEGDNKVREWRDVDDIDLTVYLQEKLGLQKMTERVVRSAVELVAYRNTRNEPKDWMESLAWDQQPRIEAFFAQAFGTEDNEYTTAASRNWWIAMIARVYDPGCKFDNMVVLEGRQGKFKSTALDIIGGKWFMEATETIGHKDFLQSLNGKLLVEIAELDSFSKADIRSIKKTISCRVDTYRASFGRRAQDFKRRCVFVGSTNEDEYLEDSTGGRRFWPIKTGTIDLNLIREHRDQLFAEAVHKFKAGASWWVMPALAGEEQESRRRADAWEDVVLPWLSGRDNVKLHDVATGCLNLPVSQFDKRAQMRLGAVMRCLGWIRKTERRGSKVEKCWVRTLMADPFVPTSKSEDPSQTSLFGRPSGVRNEAPGAE
jgi:putative DNA primase/helicase